MSKKKPSDIELKFRCLIFLLKNRESRDFGYSRANIRIMGANTEATSDITVIIVFSEGPAVSLKGSPTVSPITAALWASEPFPPKAPASMYFLALSQAPPEFAMKSAKTIPVTMLPARNPAKDSFPRKNPVARGATIASMQGSINSFKAPLVAMSTHFA